METNLPSARASSGSSQKLYWRDSLWVICDRTVAILLFIWVSKAWFYPVDVQVHKDIEAPFYSYFVWLAQAGGLYAIIRLGKRVTDIFSEWLLLLFIAWGAVSTLWSLDPGGTLGLVRTMVLLVLAAVMVRDRIDFSQMLNMSLFVGGVILMLSMAVSLLTPFGKGEGLHAGAWRGLFGHKNALGEFTAFYLILIIGTVLSREKLPRLYWLFLPPALLCFIFSGSVNSIGSVGCATAVIILAAPIGRLRTHPLVKVILFISAISLFIFLFFEIMHYMIEISGRDMTFSGRTGIWEGYMALIERNPWQGVGWGASGTQESLALTRAAINLEIVRSAHNAYIQTAYELGYVALALQIAWLVTGIAFAAVETSATGRSTAVLRLAVISGMAFAGAFESGVSILPCSWLAMIIICRRSLRPRSSRKRAGGIAPTFIRDTKS
jgi:O-antigen ligase